MNEPIVIENLTKYYNNFLALDNVSLRIEGNENVGFSGPNGAGKSTTLKILCGLIRATSGKAYIKGFNIATQKEKALSQIGTIIETPEFYGFLTPKETLNYFGRLRAGNGYLFDSWAYLQPYHNQPKAIKLERKGIILNRKEPD
jgi:ABC-2 type transport system ATP-binding protein